MQGAVGESRITSKGQTTVPKAIRLYLKLGQGDTIVWKIERDGRVVVEKGA